MRPTDLKLAATILCLVLNAGPAAAQRAEDGQGRALVRNFVENVRTMSGRFEQSLVDADDQVVESSQGTLEIQRPGRFRWSYSEPYEQLLVADGLNVWAYDVDLAQVTVKAQAEVLGSTPASLLGGSLDVLEEFEFIGSFSDRGTVWVQLRPRDDDSGFSQVDLGFSDGNLTRMIFSDTLEQTTLIALFDMAVNERIDPERFRFAPPADADLVGTPVSPGKTDM